MSHNQRGKLLDKFEHWMIKALEEHIGEGCSVGSFSGRYRITDKNWRSWIIQVPELAELKVKYNIKKNKQKRYWGMDK